MFTDIILKDNRNQEGIFFSFGDSVSNMFISSLTSGPYRNLCKKTFIACRPIYHWVYDMAKYWGDGVKSPREPLPDDADYDHERVINDIKKVSFKFKKYKIENFNTQKWGLRSAWLRNLVPSFHHTNCSRRASSPGGTQWRRGTQRLFSVKYLSGEAKLPRIFHSLRKAKTSR